ncbi:MAG: GAF domain-containing sensor histidine kinase, partial [Actinomycetota bacterium]|nr:GAF domain-containing sensor histidine kinase [Actinomycetota bacterium]
AYAAYTAYAVAVLVSGLGAALAGVSPGLHDTFHVWGFRETLLGRAGEAMGDAAHRTAPLAVADYAFSAFNLALAGFLLWLRPRELAARLLAVGMTGTAAVFNLQAYGVYEALTPTTLDAVAHGTFQVVAAMSYVLALLVFPDGRLVPRWPPAKLVLLYLPATAAVAALVMGIQGTSRTVALIMVFGLLTPAVGVAAQAYRYGRAPGELERQQSRLLFWALVPALLVGLFVLTRGINESAFADFEGRSIDVIPVALFRVFQPVFGIIPLALFVGILRYRLWNIDRVVNRTLVYGALAGFVSVVYIAVVVGLGRVIGTRGDNVFLSIAATGLVAVAFEPVRDRVQRLANRLVYGQRATPYEVLSSFAQRMGDELVTEERLARMARLLAEGTGARRADVWLVIGRELRPAASWPEEDAPTAALALHDGQLPPLGPVTGCMPVRHHGELLGALAVTKPGTEALNPVESKLLTDLAGQAGLVLRNVRLTAELLDRVEELRASRQRLVTATDEARRRLERNLHDGAQQQLVALKVRLGLAERFAAKGMPVDELLRQLSVDTDDAIETLRDLARGIYPPLLAAEGLPAALVAQARKAALPVTVEADGVGRYDQAVEAAVYFCCLEALQNIAKYANATQARIRLHANLDTLTFTVTDDGDGFDPETTTMGAGLTNMTDRIDALGGTLSIDSTPGVGTVLTGWVPAG